MLAQSYSEDAKTAPNGGDLGIMPESALDQSQSRFAKVIHQYDSRANIAVSSGCTPDGIPDFEGISKETAGQRILTIRAFRKPSACGLFNKKDQLLRDAFYEVARDEAKVVNYLAGSILASRDKK